MISTRAGGYSLLLLLFHFPFFFVFPFFFFLHLTNTLHLAFPLFRVVSFFFPFWLRKESFSKTRDSRTHSVDASSFGFSFDRDVQQVLKLMSRLVRCFVNCAAIEWSLGLICYNQDHKRQQAKPNSTRHSSCQRRVNRHQSLVSPLQESK